MLNEIQFANLKSQITDGGHAHVATVATRLGWGAERLSAWFGQNSDLLQAIGPDEREALDVLCDRGIRTTFAEYQRAAP